MTFEIENFDESDEELIKFLNSEEIYMDFEYINELVSINTEPSQSESIEVSSIGSDQIWGNHTVKPQAQVEWDKQLKQISSVMANFDPTQPVPPYIAFAAEMDNWRDLHAKDIRPRAQDQITKEFLLIDSGAQISVWPYKRVPDAKLDPLLLYV